MDMYSYLVYFERIISLTKAKCIDATEGGAKIEGTEIMTLREVIDKYCQEEFEVREILEEASRIREKVNLEELKEEMEKVIRRLKEINFYAGEGQKVIRRLQRELRQRYSNHQELKNLARESNQLEEKIMKVESYIRSFLEDEMYSHLYLAQRKANLRLDKLSKRKKLFNQVEKVGIFYDGVKKGTEKLINNFELSFTALCKLYS